MTKYWKTMVTWSTFIFDFGNLHIYTYIHIAYIIYIYILINLIGSIHISRIGDGWQPEGYNTWRNYWIQVQSIYLWHSAVLIQNHWSWSPNWFQVFVFARKVLYFRNLTGRYQASLLEFPVNKANWIAMWIHVTFPKKERHPRNVHELIMVDHGRSQPADRSKVVQLQGHDPPNQGALWPLGGWNFPMAKSSQNSQGR